MKEHEGFDLEKTDAALVIKEDMSIEIHVPKQDGDDQLFDNSATAAALMLMVVESTDEFSALFQKYYDRLCKGE
jgi:hypothetical protein